MAGSDSEARFEGAGQEFHAKYMGSVEVSKSKGQEVCQEAMQKLLTVLKTRKEPKPRLIINLSFEGTRLKEMPPGINLMDMTFKHSQVSYVWKDPRDQRSLGIVRTEVDPDDSSKVVHKFHGIRTVKPAMPFLQEMQELFRIVKERSTQQKERAASVAAADAVANKAPAAGAPANGQEPPPPPPPAADAAPPPVESRDRGASNLLGPDLPLESSGSAGLPKNASVASLDDLGDIFSASATIGQQQQQPLPVSQPMGGGGSPFGQPMGGSGNPFGQPMGGSGGGQFGQPMGGVGGGQFGQPMGGLGGGQFGQPMGGGGQFGQPGAPTNPFGQPMGGGGGGAAYGYPAAQQRSPVPFGYHQQQQQQPPQQPYYQQQASQPGGSSTNPFASVFDRQNSHPAGGGIGGEEPLMPVSLNPQPAKAAESAKPDAFSDLVVGLTSGGSSVADPKRQQVSSKDLFKPVDKPKTSLRELANQSPRPQ